MYPLPAPRSAPSRSIRCCSAWAWAGVSELRPVAGPDRPPASGRGPFPASAGIFLACATIWRLLPALIRCFSLATGRFSPLAAGCAVLACAGALLVQGCALGDRAGPATAPAPGPAQAAPAAPQAPASPRPPRPLPAPRPADSAAGDAVEAPAARAEEQGQASWYGASLHRRRTASGERFDMHAFTAAHPSLPFGTQVCVRSLVNGKVVQVRINDRGPHTAGRIIDLSRAAARALDMLGRGTKPVVLTVLEPEEKDCPPT
nr:septal ring lytic transglycosylase RlpA family protein [Acidovorax sp. SRB_14]